MRLVLIDIIQVDFLMRNAMDAVFVVMMSDEKQLISYLNPYFPGFCPGSRLIGEVFKPSGEWSYRCSFRWLRCVVIQV
jgi:hypothetical protein